MPHSGHNTDDIRTRLRKAIEQLEHVLPGQAPIKDFVHHNTLHGYQHLIFPDALQASRETTGAYAYLEEEKFRELFNQGRITHKELAQVIDDDSELEASKTIFTIGGLKLRKLDVYVCGLLYPIKPLTSSQLNWQIEELNCLNSFQQDVTEENRKAIIKSSSNNKEADVVEDLWSACLETLGLESYILHPEELMDLSPNQAEDIMSTYFNSSDVEDQEQYEVRQHLQRDAEALLRMLLKRVGNELTLRGLLKAVTGQDLLDNIRPILVRHLGNYLDGGLASWHNKDRAEGFYQSWRRAATNDLAWTFDEIPDWHDVLDSVPDDAFDTVVSELKIIGIPEDRWENYLQQLALEIPGWSGLFLWRHLHPDYNNQDDQIDMMDYLAVRLVLERLFAQQLCRRTWNIAPNLDLLQWYFRSNKKEFLVRYALFNLRLPEYIISRVHLAVNSYGQNTTRQEEWQHLAHLIWTWRQSPAADRPKGHSVYRSGWRLFRLAQHLGLSGTVIRALSREQSETLLECLDQLTPDKSGFIWLQAYENHYRDQLFNAVLQNHGRGRWSSRIQRPQAQLVFCMDDREESIRRHLEEHNPEIETLGAAGFFGVAINWKALDDKINTPLCPIAVTPAHEVHETPRPDSDNIKSRHDHRKLQLTRLQDFFFNDTRHQLLVGTLAIVIAAPLTLLGLVAKIFSPLMTTKLIKWLHNSFEPVVPTKIDLTAIDDGTEATQEHNRHGFTDHEQADRVQNFLRSIGLTKGFAPLVIMMGHGSSSQNNPHRAAYDCGACAGRHGGPNARVFAAMANRPEIRAILGQQGISIPNNTWFLGAMHNTCDESISWYDLEDLPNAFEQHLQQLQNDLDVACHGSAHERCRKFSSAPRHPGYKQALTHIRNREADISQARPELGHATNAAAFIGRRSLSQGAFFDRRVFLVSYDPDSDPDGTIIESILINGGPVVAGINLEYYFSTVNNDQYGCSSKVTHNITGLFGVMDGSESDLRTGLPKQMIEIHEAMRLQVLVEARTEVLTKIYQRQPVLQELVGNGWLLLSAKDPDNADIQVFNPKKGWIAWHHEFPSLETVDNSKDWYSGHMSFLPPVLIRQSEGEPHA